MESEESIASKYIIIDKKGHGATANVFLVKEPNTNKTYAAKVLKEQSDLFDKEIEILIEQIMEFLIQSDLLKHTISNMKKTIEDSFENNKNNLKSEEINKYEEAISTANNILDEINKVNFDKKKILDSLQKLQQISNDIDGMLGI